MGNKIYHLCISLIGLLNLIIGFYNKNELLIGYGIGLFILFLYELLIIDNIKHNPRRK